MIVLCSDSGGIVGSACPSAMRASSAPSLAPPCKSLRGVVGLAGSALAHFVRNAAMSAAPCLFLLGTVGTMGTTLKTLARTCSPSLFRDWDKWEQSSDRARPTGVFPLFPPNNWRVGTRFDQHGRPCPHCSHGKRHGSARHAPKIEESRA
jgi:hypothetical protein